MSAADQRHEAVIVTVDMSKFISTERAAAELGLASGTPVFRVALLGEKGVGKSTFLKRFVQDERITALNRSCSRVPDDLGLENAQAVLVFCTSVGDAAFIVTEIPSAVGGGACFDGTYITAVTVANRDQALEGNDAAILMFSTTAQLPHVSNHHNDVLRVLDAVPVLLAANKCDLKDLKVSRYRNYYQKANLPYFGISARLGTAERMPPTVMRADCEETFLETQKTSRPQADAPLLGGTTDETSDPYLDALFLELARTLLAAREITFQPHGPLIKSATKLA